MKYQIRITIFGGNCESHCIMMLKLTFPDALVRFGAESCWGTLGPDKLAPLSGSSKPPAGSRGIEVGVPSPLPPRDPDPQK